MPLASYDLTTLRPLPSPLGTIRLRTQHLHAQLEAAVDLSSALASRDAYGQLLLRYLTIYQPLEDQLSRLPAHLRTLIQHPQRSRVRLLLDDLQALGISTPGSLPFLVPSLLSINQVLGTLYVVEGSALGGQIIYRLLQRRLQLDHTAGAAFFYGEGDQTGAAWQHFLELLQHNVSDPEQAAAAAVTTFQLFRQALAPPPATTQEAPSA